MSGMRRVPWGQLFREYLLKQGPQDAESMIAAFAYYVPPNVAVRMAVRQKIRSSDLAVLVARGRIAYIRHALRSMKSRKVLQKGENGKFCLAD